MKHPEKPVFALGTHKTAISVQILPGWSASASAPAGGKSRGMKKAIETIKGDDWNTTGKPGKLADGGGLLLDVRSATSASWLFKYTYGGKPDEMGLGSRIKVSLDDARKLRRWAQDELNALRNPKESRQDMKRALVRDADAPELLSVYELAKAKVHLIAKKLKSEQGRKAWVQLHADFIGDIAGMDPAKVTEDDVKPLLTRLYTGKDLKDVVVCKPTPVKARTHPPAAGGGAELRPRRQAHPDAAVGEPSALGGSSGAHAGGGRARGETPRGD